MACPQCRFDRKADILLFLLKRRSHVSCFDCDSDKRSPVQRAAAKSSLDPPRGFAILYSHLMYARTLNAAWSWRSAPSTRQRYPHAHTSIINLRSSINNSPPFSPLPHVLFLPASALQRLLRFAPQPQQRASFCCRTRRDLRENVGFAPRIEFSSAHPAITQVATHGRTMLSNRRLPKYPNAKPKNPRASRGFSSAGAISMAQNNSRQARAA